MRRCLCASHSCIILHCLPTLFGLFSSSKTDLDILLQIVGSASPSLKGTKARVQIVFPNCGVNNEILGLHKLVGKQWNLSKFGGTGRRMALSAQCLPSTNGLSVASAALHATVDKVDTRLDILSLWASDLISRWPVQTIIYGSHLNLKAIEDENALFSKEIKTKLGPGSV